jgi:ribose-phosphate pyrophosphokinase
LARGLHCLTVTIEAVVEHQITVLAGPASVHLGADVCKFLRISPAPYDCLRFPDGEALVEIHESVRGHDVYILQATSPPVEEHLMQLLLLADACRRAGAGRLTAVIPYFGYARQERRSARRSLGARVAANIIGSVGFDRLMLIDAHTPAIEGFFDVPLDHLTAVPLLAQAAAATSIHERSVVVAPDLGAVKLARAYANQLHIPMAFVHKTRLDGDRVEAHAVIGDVRGRLPLIVDDMLSTGATIEAAVGALRAADAETPMSVVVTHALLVGRAREILQRLPLTRTIATDTVVIAPPTFPQLDIVSVASLLATAIRRNHWDESLADLRASA